MKESRLQHLLRSRENYRKWLAVFVLLAILVTAGVGAALHKTGVAAVYTKRVLHCPYAEMTGQVAHTHATDCYAPDGVTLVCPLQELAAHTHTPECYTEQRTLICGLEENPGHVHDDTCYTLTRGALLCTDESPEHVHTDECYEMIPTLSCGLEEGAGAHVHSDACWQVEQVLSCGLQELAEHVHDAGCFIDVELTDEEIAALGLDDETGSEAVENQTNPDETNPVDETNKTDETIKTDEEIIPVAEESGAEVLMPAVKLEEATGSVRVIVEADEGVFPAGTKMEVKEIETEDVLTAVTGAVDGKVMQVKAVDIVFRNALGEEIQPLNPIRVRMEPVKDTEINAAAESAKTSENENFQVVHVDDEGKGEVVETTEELTQEEAVSVLVDNAMVFDADHFSVYAFVYTVYYEYEVNGQTYASEVPGAQDVYLSDLISCLYVVDAAQVPDFMSKIQNVSVSNPDVVMLTPENGDWVIRPVKSSDVPEALTITMQDGAVFSIRVDAKGSSEVTSENNTATISTVNDLFLPEAAEAKAEILTEEKSENAIAAVQAVENTADSTAAEAVYQVYDISLENVTPEDFEDYKEGFNVTVALDHNINGKDFRLYHIHDGITTDITASLELDSISDKNGVNNVRGFSFHTDNFSEFVLSYTVDFYYGEYSFSINGGEKITLAELVRVLGIIDNSEDGSVENFLAKVSNVEFSDEHLLKVVHPETDITVQQAVTELGVEQVFSVWLDEGERERILSDTIHANEWALISLLPFDTEEKLTITMNNGEAIIVKVKDDAISQQSGSDNLSSFLYEVSVSNVEDGGTVKVGRTYTMQFSFKELGDSQLSTTQPLIYKIPDGIKMVQQSGTFNVTYAGTTYSGNTFTYDESTNTITINFSDTVKALVAKSADANFTIDINGQFTGEATHFDFSQAISKDYVINSDHNTSVNKNGSYKSEDNKVHYTVTASSDGRSDHVVITDTVTGTALNYDRGSIQVNGNSAPYTVEETDNGFVVILDSMNDQETVTVTYTASVDFDNITGKGTVTQTGNTVKIEADNDPGEEKPTDISNQIDYNPLSKSAGAVSGSGNTKTVPWTITVNEQQLKSVAGSTITDHNNSQDVMKYSGSGITIAVMDGTRTVRTITKTWAELGVDDPSTAATWSYKLPDTDDDLNNTYKYVITYETTVDASGKITDFSVNNGVSDDEGHNGGGGTNVTPGEDKITLEKTNVSYSAATSEWEISFNVPKDGLSSAVVTDRFPEKWASAHWTDTLTGDIVIEGLLDEESYSIDTSSESQVVITFYKTGEKTEANQGLQASESERTVTVKLSTENNPEWVQSLTGDTHTNTASLNVNGQVVTDTANSYPKSEGIAKTGSFEGTTNINGREYPVFKYTLNLYDVSEQSFDTNNKLTITDTYNGDYLKLWVKTEQEDWGELRWSWPNNNHAHQGGRTTWTDNNGTLTITADKSEFVLDGNGLYNSVYQIYYYLIVKDEETLNNLESVSIRATDHKVPIENTATWGTFHDSVKIDYEYPGVDKEQLGHADSKGMVKYKIVLNPDKQTLNNGQPMEMQDSATNISVDYSTIVIESDPAANITYYYRGYTGYYTIPDNTKVTITYYARVIGDGQVPISNDAVMKGFKDSTSSTETGSNSGSGNLNIDWVVVYKHEWRKMEKGLNGAVYVLTDEDGNPILYPASATNGLVGQPVTFTTGRIDLNALPDGTRLADETNYRDGYAWMFLDKDQTGLAFQKGITYYFKEYEAPQGYQKSDTVYTFRISEHPDYDDWEYYKGDVLRLADSEVEGNLTIRKTFVGAANLTDTQKQQITFKITAVDSSGAPIRIPYTKDEDDNNVYADITGLEISYADFVNGVYKLENLPNGMYTVQETNTALGGYTHISTTYTVDGETGTESDFSGSVTISDKTPHAFEYVNTYAEEDAHIRIVKKDADAQISLYGATFQLFKKDSSGDYVAVTDHEGLTADGKFTIDYDNRDNGVTITGLGTGEYYIKETKAPTDYQLDETPFYFSVNASNKKVTGGQHGTNVTFENAANGKKLVATVTDKISHTYTLTKVDEFRLSKKLNGAEFTVAELTGFNSEGAIVPSDTNYWTYTTGEEGTFVIDADKLGLATDKVYVIWETKAPAGYELNTKIYAFYLGGTSDVQADLMKLSSHYQDASIVSLANGPQKTTVPNKEQSMDLYAYKQWYKVDGTKDKDLVSWITEIEVQLFRVVTDSNGTVLSDAPYPDAETTYTLSQGAGGNSAYLDYKWEDLPTGYSVNTNNPLTYTYYVKEVVPEGYEARYVLGTGGGNSLTDTENVHTEASDITVGADSTVKTVQIRNSPEVLNLQMEKVWLDDGSHWNNNAVTFHIRYTDNTHTRDNPGTPNSADLGGNYMVDPQLPNNSNVEGNRYAYKWPTLAPWTDNDPSNPRTYFVLEDSGHISNMQNAGYGEPAYSTVETENGEKIIITNKKTQSDKLQVKKVWLNADGTEMTPEEITAKGIPVEVQLQRIAGKFEGINVTVQKNGGIIKTEQVAAGSEFSFTVSIKQVQGEATGFVPVVDNATVELLSSVNLYGDFYTHTYSVTINPVTKEEILNVNTNSITSIADWQIEIGNYNFTKPSMSVKDGEALQDVSTDVVPEPRVTLDSSNGWMKNWGNLPTDALNGYQWFYSVREVNVPAGFEVSYVNNDGIQTGIMYVENVKSEYTRATAYKKWLDASGAEIAAPSGAEVVYTLYQDGRKTNQTVTLDGTVDANGETDSWVATFEGLEMFKADGTTLHEYTVKELTGYTGYSAVTKNTETNEWESTETSNTVESGGTIYNKKVRQIHVTKKWLNQSGEELAEAPDGSVRIDLFKKTDLEHPVAFVTLDGRIDPHGEETPWVATFSNLDDNTAYVVKEGECTATNFTLDSIDPAESAVTGDGSFTVTNKQSQQTTVTLNIVKVNASDMESPLPGAQFVLKELDPNGKGTYPTSGGLTKQSEVTNDSGESGFAELSEGYYEISETKIPDGYVLVDEGKFFIHVTTDGSIILLDKDTAKPVSQWSPKPVSSADKIKYNSVNKTVTVGNTPGTQLPQTGGIGTTLFTALGGLITVTAGAILTLRRKRKTA